MRWSLQAERRRLCKRAPLTPCGHFAGSGMLHIRCDESTGGNGTAAARIAIEPPLV